MSPFQRSARQKVKLICPRKRLAEPVDYGKDVYMRPQFLRQFLKAYYALFQSLPISQVQLFSLFHSL